MSIKYSVIVICGSASSSGVLAALVLYAGGSGSRDPGFNDCEYDRNSLPGERLG